MSCVCDTQTLNCLMPHRWRRQASRQATTAAHSNLVMPVVRCSGFHEAVSGCGSLEQLVTGNSVDDQHTHLGASNACATSDQPLLAAQTCACHHRLGCGRAARECLPATTHHVHRLAPSWAELLGWCCYEHGKASQAWRTCLVESSFVLDVQPQVMR